MRWWNSSMRWRSHKMQILPGRNNKATTKWLQLWGQLSLQRRSFLSVWWMQYMSMSKWWSWVCCKKGVQWPDQNATKIRCKLLTSNFSHSGVNLHLPNFTSLSALLWNGKLMYKKYILEIIYLIWFHFDRRITLEYKIISLRFQKSAQSKYFENK